MTFCFAIFWTDLIFYCKIIIISHYHYLTYYDINRKNIENHLFFIHKKIVN